MLAKVDDCSCASEMTKSINQLTAIRWISQAWSDVKLEMIPTSFRSGEGLNNSELGVSSLK